MSFALYRELGAPTAVEAAVWARLLAGVPEVQLVVARGSILDVYALGQAACCKGDPFQGEPRVGAQLQLIATTQVAAHIQSLSVVRLSGAAAAVATRQHTALDVLLVTAKHAKAALMGLDPFTMRMKTLAMLNFEADATGAGSWVRGEATSVQNGGLAGLAVAAVDPDSRAAAMMVYEDQLAVMPLRRAIEGVGDADDAVYEDEVALFKTAPATAAPDTPMELSADSAARALPADSAVEASAYAVAAMDTLTRSIMRRPYIVDLTSVGRKGLAGTVRDMAFLHGYSVEPTLALLVARGTTSASRQASLSNNCCVAAVSFDVQNKLNPVIWQRDGLPHDAFAVAAVPQPVGGLVVLTPSAVLYFNQMRFCGLALNAYAAFTVDVRGNYKLDTNKSHDRTAPSVCISADAARLVFLDPAHLLMVIRDGTGFIVTLHLSMSGEVHHLTIMPTGTRGPQTTALAYLPAPSQLTGRLVVPNSALPRERLRVGMLFQASHIADSLLSICALDTSIAGGQGAATTGVSAGGATSMQLEEEDSFLYGDANGAADQAGSASVAPRAATGPAPSTASATTNMSLDDEDAFLYGAPIAVTNASSAGMSGADGVAQTSVSESQAEQPSEEAASAGPSEPAAPLSLFPVDALPNVGPVSDAALGRSTKVPAEDDEAPPVATAATELVATCGAEHTGAISVIHRALPVIPVTELPLPGVRGAWFIQCTPPHQDTDDAGTNVSAFLVLSTASNTRVLAYRDGLNEVSADEVEFLMAHPTLAVGVVLQPQESAAPEVVPDPARMRMVQVHAGGVRVLLPVAAAPATQEVDKDLPLDVGGLGAAEGIEIVDAQVRDPFVLLRLSDGTLRLLRAEQDGDLVVEQPVLAVSASRDHVAHNSDPVTAASLFTDVAGAFVDSPAPAGQRAGSTFAVVTFRSGLLAIFAVPSFKAVFAFHGAHVGPQVITNHLRGRPLPKEDDNEPLVKQPGHSSVAAEVDEAAEPCEDPGPADTVITDGDPMGHDSSQQRPRSLPHFPRSYIREVSAAFVPKLALVAVSSNDDTYVYLLQDAIVNGPDDATLVSYPAVASPYVGVRHPVHEHGPQRPAALAGTSPISKSPSSEKADQMETARFMDAGIPLQYSLASVGARFLRLPMAVVTRFVDPALVSVGPQFADAAAAQRREAIASAYLRFSPRRIVPFANVGEWSGFAVLTPTPIWLLANRNTLCPVVMDVPDVTGAGGPTAVPGDVLHTPDLVTAFSPFDSPECPLGCVMAHQGSLQFARLARPAWPSGSGAVPCMPQVAAIPMLQNTSGVAPPPGAAAAVFAMVATATAPQHASSVIPIAVESDRSLTRAKESEEQDGDNNPFYFGGYDVPPTLMVTHGGTGSVVFTKQYVQATVQNIVYLELSSSAAGASSVASWAAAAAVSGRGPAPAPSAAQLAVAVLPLYLAAVSLPRERNFAAEASEHAARIEAEGGEFAQVEYGQHIELADPPLKPTGNDPVADGLAHAFNAAGLTAPPLPDTEHELCLYYGSDSSTVGGGWRVADSYRLNKGEHVLAFKEVPLAVYDPSRAGGQSATTVIPAAPVEGHVVVGTGYLSIRGEDAPPRGRILVFRIVKGAADGAAAAGHKLHLVFEKEIGAPVTAVAALSAGERRHVIIALPRAVQVHAWSGGTLKLISWSDANVYVRDVAVVGQYILFGDVYHSLRFLQWREADRNLLALARDPNPLPTAAVELMAHDKILGIVAADEDGNLVIYAYAPRDAHNKLVVRADFHSGSPLARLVRSRAAVPVGTPAASRRRFLLLAPAISGSIGALLPLDELVFKRLYSLQKLMTYTLQQPGGFSPKEWRAFSPGPVSHLHRPRAGNVLDGTLLWTFTSLDLRLQNALAAGIGTTIERLLDNLRQLDLSCVVF